MPAAVREFAAGLEVDEPQARLYLAVREVARVRLFGAVPWLAPALLAAVRDYAADISIDTTAIEEAVGSIDPSDPEAVQQALQGRMFAPQHSPAQQAALARLETLLALVEGWVDVVADRGHPRAPPAGRRARRGRAPPPGHGRAGREGVRCARRARAAPAPAARRGEPVRRARGVRRRGRPRRRLAPSRPRSRARPTSTTRWATSSARRSPQTDEMDAALDRLLRGEDDA